MLAHSFCILIALFLGDGEGGSLLKSKTMKLLSEKKRGTLASGRLLFADTQSEQTD